MRDRPGTAETAQVEIATLGGQLTLEVVAEQVGHPTVPSDPGVQPEPGGGDRPVGGAAGRHDTVARPTTSPPGSGNWSIPPKTRSKKTIAHDEDVDRGASGQRTPLGH